MCNLASLLTNANVYIGRHHMPLLPPRSKMRQVIVTGVLLSISETDGQRRQTETRCGLTCVVPGLSVGATAVGNVAIGEAALSPCITERDQRETERDRGSAAVRSVFAKKSFH